MAFFPIPSMLLKQLYTYNSLKNTDKGVKFSIKNRLTDVKFSELQSIKINGNEISREKITFDLGDGEMMSATNVTEENPLDFPLRKVIEVHAETENLEHGKHKIKIAAKAKGYGSLKFEVEDAIAETENLEVRIPRDEQDDYSEKAIENRQKFVEEYSENKARTHQKLFV